MSLRITFRPGKPAFNGPLELTFGGRGARGLPSEGGDGGGAPTNAPYVTFGTNATLSNERVLSDGTGTSIDVATAGQIKVTNTDRGSTAVTSHVGESDPHPQYLKAAITSVNGDEGPAVTINYDTIGAEEAGTAAALMISHLAASDPHTQYTTAAELASALASYLTTAAAAAGYQPLDSDLTAIAALSTTAFGRALLALADAAALRTSAGLGTLATVTPTGTPDGTKFLRDDNTWQTPSGGGSPGGSGSEIQYRSGSSTFGAVANVSRGANGNLLLAAQSTPGSLSDGELFQGSQKTLSAYLNGIHHRFVGCLFSQTADATVANTTAETTFIGSGVGTVTLPANFLLAGKTLRVVARGIYSSLASGSGTINLQLKLGSTVVLATGTGSVGNSVTGRSWSYEAHITCRSAGASGTVSVQGSHTRLTGSGAATNYDLKNSSPVTVDTTASQAVNLTATLSVADPGVTFTCTNLTVEVLN